MEYLCAEIGKLGGFLEVQVVHGRSLFHETRVVVVHSVDVGPDLYLIGFQSCAYQRRGVVASASLEVVDSSVLVAADESLCDIKVGVGILIQYPAQILTREVDVRLAFTVYFHEVESRDKH